MTLVLTCLTREIIVQASDRRLTWPDGSLADDDRNKAVFYCGRIALAYAGLSQLEGVDTSEWLGRQISDVATIEPALEQAAERASRHLRRSRAADKRVAFVATGWLRHQNRPPPRAFWYVASNFLSPEGEWLARARDAFVMRLALLPEDSSHLLIPVGQPLHPDEESWLDREIRRCLKHGVGPAPYARLLGQAIQAISGGSDFRAKRVGRGLIVQALSWAAIESRNTLLVTPLTAGVHSFLYVGADGTVDPFQGAVLACEGAVLTGFGGGTFRPGEKSTFES